MAADIRDCEQCGTAFAPRREHARFCSAPCRAAWNREHQGDPAAGVSALRWSITAMSDTTGRLPKVRAVNRPRAFAVIGEAVWWVTIVDATLVRHYPEAYDAVMAGWGAPRRQLIEGTLAGLRFVRNRIGDEADLADFIEPSNAGSGAGRITDWKWRPVPEPGLASLPPRGQAWEITRYRAYQAHLAGHNIAESFCRVAEFLKLASAATPPNSGISAPAVRLNAGYSQACSAGRIRRLPDGHRRYFTPVKERNTPGCPSAQRCRCPCGLRCGCLSGSREPILR